MKFLLVVQMKIMNSLSNWKKVPLKIKFINQLHNILLIMFICFGNLMKFHYFEFTLIILVALKYLITCFFIFFIHLMCLFLLFFSMIFLKIHLSNREFKQTNFSNLISDNLNIFLQYFEKLQILDIHKSYRNIISYNQIA